MTEDDHRTATEPSIHVTENGPYLVTGPIEIRQTDGSVLTTSGPCYLCRCGGSKNKPFCDATHGLKGFIGTETAERDAEEAGVSSETPSISPTVDGPYEVRGAVPLIDADGRAYELRERRTLCRCGQSGNKPLCDGSHRYAEFRDPLPPELAPIYPTLYEYAGGIEAFEVLTTRFYHDIMTEPDPLLEPVFRHMDAAHAQHVAAWLAETFGGPAAYTRDHGGYHHMVNKHRDLDLTEQQRRRWIDRMIATADLVGLPEDPDFRAAFVSYLEWGTRIAVFNSRPGVELIQHAPVPQWTWGAAPPFVPFPWDDPEAAERGRRRSAAEHAPPD